VEVTESNEFWGWLTTENQKRQRSNYTWSRSQVLAFWAITLMEVLMILYRICFKLVEILANRIYQRRIREIERIKTKILDEVNETLSLSKLMLRSPTMKKKSILPYMYMQKSLTSPKYKTTSTFGLTSIVKNSKSIQDKGENSGKRVNDSGDLALQSPVRHSMSLAKPSPSTKSQKRQTPSRFKSLRTQKL